MPDWRCKIGWHKWTLWDVAGFWQYVYSYRQCLRCGKEQKTKSMNDEWNEEWKHKNK